MIAPPTLQQTAQRCANSKFQNDSIRNLMMDRSVGTSVKNLCMSQRHVSNSRRGSFTIMTKVSHDLIARPKGRALIPI